jgi:hypothetical protein
MPWYLVSLDNFDVKGKGTIEANSSEHALCLASIAVGIGASVALLPSTTAVDWNRWNLLPDDHSAKKD